MSDKKTGFMNVFISIVLRILLLVASLINRRFLINFIGNEVNGLNALFVSIIGFLSVAELGAGTAIVFCMYKPIVDGDKKKIIGLYSFFKKMYYYVGIIIFILGLCILPLLPYLAKDYSELNVNVYLTFFLMLVSTVLTYTYSAKSSLFNAYKENYIANSINSGCQIFREILQIIIIIITKSFFWFLICRIVATVFDWFITNIVSKKMHGDIIAFDEKLDIETKNEVKKNIAAMFMHKIGSLLVSTADSLIISIFIGVIVLGKYSNYSTIMAAMVSVITLIFSPLTSIIGHKCVSDSTDKIESSFNMLYYANYMIAFLFFLGYFYVIDQLIVLLFGDGLLLSKSVAFVLTLNQFVQFMRQATLTYKDATGCFYYDRYKPLLEGICNIILSILLVIFLPEEYNVVGVILATIITNLLVCHTIEPYVLYKHFFKKSMAKYCLKNYFLIFVFALTLFLSSFLTYKNSNIMIELVVNGGISIFITLIVVSFVLFINKNVRKKIFYYFRKISKK